MRRPIWASAVDPAALPVADGTLLVPMIDIEGALQNLQRIAPQRPTDGSPEKRFLPGGRKSGLWHVIGQAEGSAVLLLRDGTQISIGPNSQVDITRFQFDATTQSGSLTVQADTWLMARLIYR